MREHLKPYHWKKGQSGNPNGGSEKASVRKAYKDLYKEHKLDKEFPIILAAMAVGKRRVLKDDEEEGGYRTPDLQAMKMFNDIAFGDFRADEHIESITNVTRRIIIPDFDARIEKSKKESGRKTKGKSRKRNLSKGTVDLGTSGNREDLPDNDVSPSTSNRLSDIGSLDESDQEEFN